MTSIKAAGRLLTASVDDRVLEYLLLPFGEQGRTSAGRVTASAGTLTIPERLIANLEHDGTRPVATGTVTEEDDGLHASFRVAATTAGNDLLVEAAEGLRTGVSVEIENPVIRAGKILAGELTGAGFVTKPAFPSALLVAADAGELDETATETVQNALEDALQVIEDNTEGNEPQNPEEVAVGDTTVQASATAPAGGLAARRTTQAPKGPQTKGELFKLLANAHRRGGAAALTAALTDIVPADTIGIEQPQYVGELWSGKAYDRRIIPLFNHSDLTSFEVRGWRWVTKPVVAPYAGNKTDVPSNEVQTEQVTLPAERIAGAHDIDRKHRDFNDEAFFAAYYAAMTESYAQVSDAQVLADVLAEATPVTPGTVPTDVPAGLAYIVDGALAVLDETRTSPTFALVATDLWRAILLTPKDKTLEYLSSSLGLEEGSTAGFRIVPAPELSAGQVLVGAKAAVTVHELGGPAPIRVEAIDVAKGGVDAGVFGYYATNVHDADGLALVDATP